MANDYVSLFRDSPLASMDPLAMLSLAFLFMGRIFPILTQAPFFGAKVVPHPVKAALGLALFVIFLPQLLYDITTPLTFNIQLVWFLMKEIFIGIILGFLISIPFNIVQSAGIFIDHQRGGASLMVNDPTIQNQSSPLGTLFNYILIYLFFLMNGPFIFIDIISKSYEILPPDQFLSHTFFSDQSRFWFDMAKILGKVMTLSIQLAMPALLIVLMTDLFLGIANRLAPQVQITFLGMPLKSLLALTIIFLGWNLLTDQFVKESFSWLTYLNNLVNLFVPSSV